MSTKQRDADGVWNSLTKTLTTQILSVFRSTHYIGLFNNNIRIIMTVYVFLCQRNIYAFYKFKCVEKYENTAGFFFLYFISRESNLFFSDGISFLVDSDFVNSFFSFSVVFFFSITTKTYGMKETIVIHMLLLLPRISFYYRGDVLRFFSHFHHTACV